MTHAIELIYDPDCPNVEPARTVLRGACAELGLSPVWSEWNRQDAASPEYVQGFGSPTIIVNGRDVAGAAAGDMASCCRMYESDGGLTGTPSTAQIVAALQNSSDRVSPDPSSGAGRRASLSGVGSAFVLAGLCPVCWTAYAGLLGSLGVGFILDTAFLLPATLVLLAVALFALGFKATERRGYVPLMIGALAAALIVFARFVLVSDPLTFLGLATLVGVSVWNVRPMAKKSAAPCPACVTENGN